MAQFSLHAYPSWHHRDRRGMATISLLMQSIGATHRIEARDLVTIGAEVAAFGGRISAGHPGVSFGIAVIIDRRDRKPNGFDDAISRKTMGQDDWVAERDREGHPLPVVAPPSNDMLPPAVVA